MAKKIWRHTMTNPEQKLWSAEGMKGWCKAFEACVEDDARENGSIKYVLLDSSGEIVGKGPVRTLPEKKPAEVF